MSQISYSGVFKSIIISYTIYFLILPTGYLLRVLYSHSLDLEDFGLIYGILSLLSFLNIIVQFGLLETFRYFASKMLRNNLFSKIGKSFWEMFWFQLVVISAVSIVLFGISGFLAQNFFHYPQSAGVIRIFIAFFFFNNLLNPCNSIFVIHDKQPASYIISFLNNLLLLSASFLTYHFFGDQLVTYYSWLWMGSGVFLVVASYSLLFIKFPYLIKNFKFGFLQKKYFQFSALNLASNMGINVFQTVDMWIIIGFIGLAQAGIYSNALAIASLITIFLSPLSIFILPLISRLDLQKDKDRFQKIFNLLFHLGIFIALPICLSIGIFAYDIIILMFGEKFIEAQSVIRILSIFLIFKGFYIYNLNILTGLSEVKKKAILVIAVMLFNFILDIVVVRKFGILGVAVITGVSWFLVYIVSYIMITKIVQYKISFIWVAKLVFSLVIFIGLVYGLKSYIPQFNPYLRTAFIAAASYMAYLFIGYALKLISSEATLILDMVKEQFKKQKNTTSG